MNLDLILHPVWLCLDQPGFYLQDPIRQKDGGEFQMPTVVLRPDEGQDQLLRRFRKKVVKSGVLSTIRNKRWFTPPSEQRRIDAKKSQRRSRKKAH
jgi:small subunit ribosomal protein S21